MKKILLACFVCLNTLAYSQNPQEGVITMYVEEVEFTAGEVVTIDIWSEDIVNLIAWQFRLNFENAIILSIDEGEPFHDIPHNIFNEGRTINSLWVPLDAEPIDIGNDVTWFTLTVETEVAGNTFDIFTTINDPWSGIGIEDATTIEEHPAEFLFNVAPRNILSSSEDLVDLDLKLTSNLVSDNIELQGISEYSNPVIAIYNSNGQAVKTENLQNVVGSYQIDISDVNDGMYWLSVSTVKGTKTFKFVKVQK